MWVNKQLFEMIIADNKAQADKLTNWQNTCHVLQTKHDDALAQKTKDDTSIDLLRDQIRAQDNALVESAKLEPVVLELRAQKAKDDISIDWMRHRVNALEKQNAVLLQKAAGVNLPVPEIVPTRPGTMTAPDFSHLPSFEDIGDEEAKRLGVSTDDAGFIEFRADVQRRSE